MKQKRFKKVVEKKHSWVVAIIYFLLGLLFSTQTGMTLELLSNMCCPSLLLQLLSIIIGSIGFFSLIIISASRVIEILTTRKVYWVEVKE